MREVPESSRKPLDEEIDVWGLTHPGKLRKTNEDHFLLGSLHKRLDIRATSLPAAEQLWYYLHLSNWRIAYGITYNGVDHFWSLAIEEQFYLIWPRCREYLLRGHRALPRDTAGDRNCRFRSLHRLPGIRAHPTRMEPAMQTEN